jgi:D-alanyl-D-alanine dipeptidase
MSQQLPDGFGYLNDPRLSYEIAYAGSNNFVGRKIAGYNKPVCIASTSVIAAIIKVQDELDELQAGLALKIFDAYRPQTAVSEFIAWAKDTQDQTMKAQYYPNVNKQDLFDLGYLIERSRHSTGTGIDLTLTSHGVELDMGTIFDFFDETSHTAATQISPQAIINRKMLKIVMERNGFKNYANEWWHYNIVNEQFPNTYFDFPIE